ncbi:MAG: cell division protein FtsQ/DivIB [Gemmatimonadales bacterium]
MVEKLTRRLAIGLGAAALALVALLWVAVPPALRSMAAFQVRRIEIRGIKYLDEAVIVRALELRDGASIFDPTEPLERRAFALTGVGRVSIGRRLPGTLVISIDERPPVGLTATDDGLALVDRRGRLLPYDPTRGPPDLPLTQADPGVLGVVERVQEHDPTLFAQVLEARKEGSAVVLRTASYRLLFRVGATSREIEGIGIVKAEVERRKMRVSELDARFEGRVIVRRGGRT